MHLLFLLPLMRFLCRSWVFPQSSNKIIDRSNVTSSVNCSLHRLCFGDKKCPKGKIFKSYSPSASQIFVLSLDLVPMEKCITTDGNVTLPLTTLIGFFFTFSLQSTNALRQCSAFAVHAK